MNDDLKELEQRLAVHEAECKERWKTIFARMDDREEQHKRIENILIGIAGAIICGGGSVIVTMVIMHGG
jgi:uncharacterized protein with ParB-like and HNH nuclease domain